MEQVILDLLEGMGGIDFKFVWQVFSYALILFWIVVLYWVWLDSGDRTSNRFTRVLYVILVAILNIIGLIIYLIVRPGQTIEEIYWADLERRYLKYETADLGDCPKCGTQLLPGYLFCPNCKYEIKIKCSSCQAYIERKNKYCAFCGEEVSRRVSSNELVPSREIMEQQIQATKDEATEVVETNRTRYSSQKSIAVKVGEAILGFGTMVSEKFKSSADFIKSKSKEKTRTIQNVVKTQSSKKRVTQTKKKKRKSRK